MASKQSIVVTSSTGSEYVYFSNAVSYALYLKCILIVMGITKDDSLVKIHPDSNNNAVNTIIKASAPSIRWM